MSKKNDKFRSRNFRLLLYPEDPTHKDALDLIKKDYEYAYILHDQDLDNDDDCKKEHWHVVLRFANAKWNTALADELGIKPNYVRDSKDLKKSLAYLIHFFNPDKYQYDFEQVIGSKPLHDMLWAVILKANKTQEELSNEILDFIDSAGTLSFIDFMRWINANGLFSNLKSGSGWYRDVLKEHNEELQRRNKTTAAAIHEYRQPKELSEEERRELFTSNN